MNKAAFMPVGIGLGVALGTAFGVATDNLALGLSLGVAIGSGLGVAAMGGLSGVRKSSGKDGGDGTVLPVTDGRGGKDSADADCGGDMGADGGGGGGGGD